MLHKSFDLRHKILLCSDVQISITTKKHMHTYKIYMWYVHVH